MKIGTLTFHTACNYGAVLQTYALVHKLKDMGADAEVINYRPAFNERRFQKPKINDFLSIRGIYSFLFQNSYQTYNLDGFSHFIRRNIPLSADTARNIEQLTEISKNYNILISGSDQVWNPSCTEGDLAYFFPFKKMPYQIKASYAPSLGRTSFTNNERETLYSLIADFDFISVRETQGTEVLKNFGFNKCKNVLDPTLLLTKNEWRALADYSAIPDEKYLLLYVMHEDMALLRFAKQYAKSHGLKILYITQRLFHKLSGAIYLKDMSPEQWVGLFLNADTVVTNSFHGTAFGLNFEKNLYVKRIPNSNSNSRMEDILSQLNRTDAFIEHGINEEPVNTDYIILLNSLRDNSITYIQEILRYGQNKN